MPFVDERPQARIRRSQEPLEFCSLLGPAHLALERIIGLSGDRNSSGSFAGRQIDFLGDQIVDIACLRGPSPFLDRIEQRKDELRLADLLFHGV
jgi:hypothetical protein